jgi:CHAD domain-containing protein
VTKAQPSEPPASVGLRAAEVIAEQRDKMWSNLASAIDGRDPEGVHDMRVASRRLRACLKMFAPWIEADELERIAPGIRGATRALGRVRELDVLRLRVAELAARATPERALALEMVDVRIARRRRRARNKMMARFARIDLDRLEHRVQRLASHLAKGGKDVGDASEAKPRSADASEEALAEPQTALSSGEPDLGATLAQDAVGIQDEQRGDAVGHGATELADGAFAESADAPFLVVLTHVAPEILDAARAIESAQIPAEVGSPHAAEALHLVRIAAKKLRYQLEIASPYLGDAGSGLVNQLRALQDPLGEFHDDTVLDAVLQEEIDRTTERQERRLGAELRRFRASRRRALLRDERAVRAAIENLSHRGFSAALADALQQAGVAIEAAASTSNSEPLHVEAKGAGAAAP